MTADKSPYEIFAEELSFIKYKGKDSYSAADVKAMDESALKGAYRSMAMKWHPDRPEGKTEDGKARMIRINRANNILGNPAERKKYDDGLISSNGQATASSKVDLSAAFDDLFDEFGAGDNDLFEKKKPAARPQAGTTRPASRTSLDVRFPLSIDFIEAARGTSKTLNLKSLGVKFQLEIPAGIETGHELRAHGKGRSADGRSGDAIAQVNVKPHEFFKRQGNDVLLDLPVNFCEAALGRRIEVPTVHGMNSLDLPKGIGNGDQLTLKGKGIAGGDQIVTIALQMPQEIDAELETALESWLARSNSNPRAGLKIG